MGCSISIRALLFACLLASPLSGQVPQIALPLVPTSAALQVSSGPGITLTVNGTGFTSSSVVFWDGAELVTTFVNHNQVTAAVPAGDLVSPATAYITVQAPSGPISAPSAFSVTDPTVGYPVVGSLEVSTLPLSCPWAYDFNHDGNLDLLCSVSRGAGVYYDAVLFGHGDGTFGTPVAVDPPADSAYDVYAVADLNGDGNPDLIYYAGVRLGNADGTFGDLIPNSVGTDAGTCPCQYAFGDFNGDGKMDIVAVSSDTSVPAVVWVFLGNGDGTFEAGISSPGDAAMSGGGVIAVGDWNGDGIPDLGVGGGLGELCTSCYMTTLLGNGDGTFSNPVDYALGGGSGRPPFSPVAIEAADVNGDGKPDLIVQEQVGWFNIFLGNGDGTFTAESVFDIPHAAEPGIFFLADFIGNGKLDLTTEATLSLGNGDGTFGAWGFLAGSGVVGTSGPIGDFNNDGRQDFVLGPYVWLQAPRPIVAPTLLAFGNETLGIASAAKTVTLKNTGSAPLYIHSVLPMTNFSQTNDCPAPLLPGSICSFSVRFTPLTPGALSANLTIMDNAPEGGGTQFVTLSGTGVGPVAVLSPSSLAFGNETVGIASAADTVTLSNTGNAVMKISSVITTVNNGTFTQSKTCGATLPAGASCTISISWKPGTAGAMTGSIKIIDNALGSPQVATLSGTGVLPDDSLVPSSLTFPNQVVFTTSAAKTVKLTNFGLGLLVISKVAVSGPFTQTNTCGKTVAHGGTCILSVKFAPTVTGVLTGVLTVTNNALSSPQHVALTGTGTDIQLTPAALAFGNQPKGSSSLPLSVTVANQGATTVKFTSFSISGVNASDFSQSHTCGATLASGARCIVKVTFKPTATGTRKAEVAIADNGGGSPQTVALNGVGTP